MTLALGVLCSGEGTNLQAILDACAGGSLDARVHLVIANREAPCVERARRAGVATLVLTHTGFSGRDAYDRALADALRDAGVSLVVLAGFMRLVGPGLLDAFPDAVLNLHPSLLPSFPGVGALAQALAHGVAFTGCTVHLVDTGMDTGPIVAQATLAIDEGDDESSLAARLRPLEHATLLTALDWFARGLVQIRRDGARPRVVVAGARRGLRERA